MIGKTIFHYRILEKLGEGGMGIVYKAEDTKLKRTVALKFLAPQALGSKQEKERLVREAQAAAVLDHPNICTIYEINEVQGQTFISMSYIEGESVKDKIVSGPLELNETVDIAIQVASGLGEAHEKRIVHRDIKSSNIMLTSKGQAKIMDFGLARMTKGSEAPEQNTTSGTVAYMSPEQASGENVDQRTDIWSLGVVFYEMLTGQLPFKGDYNQAVIYSVLNQKPKTIKALRPEVPESLERIINKALTKNPDSRYQNTRELLNDLGKTSKELESMEEQSAKKKHQPSIAVLPFVNLSADPEQDYFCDGMAEEIINALTHVEGLMVVARTSAFVFKEKRQDIREIGRKLNVENLLEGSVRKAGNQVRITAQLINVADGYHLWSEKYDRNISELCCPEDIFAIQDEISMAIVDNLKVKLLGDEKAALLKRHTHDLDAYNLYLKGRYHWNKRTPEGLKKALKHFQKVIEKDPNYALAYAGLADCYIMLEQALVLPAKVAFPKAKEWVTKALEKDQTLAEAHASLADILWAYDRDWIAAEREFKKAIELNPNYATAHQWYAIYLSAMGRFDQAIREIKRAQELDVLSLIINVGAALIYSNADQQDQAIQECLRVLDMDPNFIFANLMVGRAYEQKEMFDKAIKQYLKEEILAGVLSSEEVEMLKKTYSGSDWKSYWRKHVEILEKKSEQGYLRVSEIARDYIRLGDNEKAIQWLEKAYQEYDPNLGSLKTDPTFDPLRPDPRFKSLLRKMGLDK